MRKKEKIDSLILLFYKFKELLNYLSEHKTDKRFGEFWAHLNKFKQVKTISMFCHHHLEEELILIRLQ